MRLIDADALLEKAWDADTRVGYVQVVDVGDILDATTINAVEVVRCKDCTYGEKAIGVAEDVIDCKRLKMVTRADWYCAEGKGETNDNI